MATHEGWKNYETWSVQLIIDNEETLYHERRRLARLAAEKPDAVTALADNLRDWVEYEAEQYAVVRGPFRHLWSQLITAALSSVDWREIAEAWLSDLQENP